MLRLVHGKHTKKKVALSNGKLTAIEVKSSMTYQPDFAKTLKLLPQWTRTPIARRAVVYGGDLENTAGDIWLLRYDHVEQLCRTIE